MEKVNIEKAKESCKTISETVSDHFVDVTKTIMMPKKPNKKKATALKAKDQESADILNSILELV